MIKPPTITEHLEAALKGASARQAAIANNIANINTPNYRRMAVEFEKHLAEAIADGRKIDLDEIASEFLRPENTPVDANGNDVNLEMEVGEMIKNSAMYKTYMRLLASTYKKMELAIH